MRRDQCAVSVAVVMCACERVRGRERALAASHPQRYQPPRGRARSEALAASGVRSILALTLIEPRARGKRTFLPTALRTKRTS